MSGIKLSAVAAAIALSAQSVFAADAMPQFSVSYFAGDCPDGWASLDGANGRFLMPTMLGGGSGAFSGEALASQGKPAHVHNTANGTVSITDRSFVLIGGCCNDNLAHSGTHSMTGSADSASSGLPYIQYRACTKTAAPSNETVPSQVMAFNILPQCPQGWSIANAAAGRYIVGLPANGAPSATFGGKALEPSEIRTHIHSMNGTIDLASHGIAGGSGCCAGGYASAGNANFTGATKPNTQDGKKKYDSAVQAPYYTGTFCQKN